MADSQHSQNWLGLLPPNIATILPWSESLDKPLICSVLFGFVTKHACDRQTDGRTEGQNYDSQNRDSIAACAVKTATA